MSTADPVPFALQAPEEPDADWAGLRKQALERVDGVWTDHNLSDPGITILEAALWSLADLHYRTAARPLAGWHAEARLDAPTGPRPGMPLAGLSTDQRERVAAAVLVHGIDLRPRVDAASSEEAAVDALMHRDLDGVLLDEPEARAVAHLVRRPGMERHGRDHSALVAAAVDQHGSAAVAALAERPELGGLWRSELDELVAREARRRQVRLLVDGAMDDAAARPCPPGAVGEDFEERDGRSRVWPPHPIQARTTEPVTAGDYRRLALALPGVKRAWVATGLLAGVGWDGRVRTTSLPYRRGGLTLVVEPADDDTELPVVGAALSAAQRAFLREVLRQALAGPGATAEVDAPYAQVRDDLDALAPRRLIGDELAAALLKAQPVVVKGVLHIDPSTTREAVLGAVDEQLAGFLSPDRLVPGAPPRPAPEPPDCPAQLHGPWPVPPEPVPGWDPGSPVRVPELVRLLADIDGVAGVESVAVRLGEAGAWEGHTLALAPDAVPRYQRHCLRVRVTKPRVCDG